MGMRMGLRGTGTSTRFAVVPAKASAVAGIRLLGAFSREPTHVRVYFVRHPGGRSLSFAAQKKATKENGTLGAAPSPLARVREGRTGSAHRPSMA